MADKYMAPVKHECLCTLCDTDLSPDPTSEGHVSVRWGDERREKLEIRIDGEIAKDCYEAIPGDPGTAMRSTAQADEPQKMWQGPHYCSKCFWAGPQTDIVPNSVCYRRVTGKVEVRTE